MNDFLSDLRLRLRRRRTKRSADKRARQGFAVLSAAKRREVFEVLEKFRPIQTGHEMLRIGPDFDGGYLVPDDLSGLVALYSPGVSDTTGFDLDMAERGLDCFLADGTVDAPAEMHPRMSFEKKMIGTSDGGNFMRLESWIERTSPKTGDLILQMDIEGAEYEVILSSPMSILRRFRIMVVELHGIDEMLLDDRRHQLSEVMDRMGESHVLCHVHPNNWAQAVDVGGRSVPPYLELTYLRSDRVKQAEDAEPPFPHPLDMPNLPENSANCYVPFWRA